MSPKPNKSYARERLMPKTARKPSVSKNSGAPLDAVSGAVVRLLSSMGVTVDYNEQKIL